LRRNAGAIWPLPLTRAEREASGDPRLSIAERYATRADYLLHVIECLVELRRDRLLLDEDVATLLDQAVGVSTLLGELRPIEDMYAELGPADAKRTYEKIKDSRAGSWTGTTPWDIARRLNAKGYSLMQSNRLDEALAIFELAVNLNPDNANAWDSLGECHMNMKSYDDAIMSYEKSLELNPDNTNATAMIERINTERSP
jgi:tetratricopeptide (TPR) repeat protein